MDLASLLSQHAELAQWAVWSTGALCLALGLGELFYRWRRPAADGTDSALMLTRQASQSLTVAGRTARWLGFGGDMRTRSGALALPNSRHQRLLQALSHSEEELWRRRDVVWPARYLERLAASNTRIIVIANLTGGHGKVSLAANLAAHFAVGRGLKVLILDMDAQGDLTALLTGASGCGRSATQLEHWLGGEADPRRLIDKAYNLKSIMPSARLVGPTESFGALEAHLSAQWAVGAGGADGRYMLAEKLLRPTVQAKFDVVIVNAPPRLSIGAINALTAATHLVIPTGIDAVSRQAARTFLQLFQSLRPALFPHLALAGIALTTPGGDRMSFTEQSDVVQLKHDLDTLGLMSATHMFVRNIPVDPAPDAAQLTKSRRRPTGLDYLDSTAAQAAFTELGDAIAFRSGLYCAI